MKLAKIYATNIQYTGKFEDNDKVELFYAGKDKWRAGAEDVEEIDFKSVFSSYHFFPPLNHFFDISEQRAPHAEKGSDRLRLKRPFQRNR